MSQSLLFPDVIHLERSRLEIGAFSCAGIRGDAGVTWIHAAGELDVATVGQLEDMLDECAPDAFLTVLDLTAVEFMAICGVHVIADACARARRVGRQLVVLGARPAVDRLLTLTAMSSQVTLIDRDVGEALAPVVFSTPAGNLTAARPQLSLVSAKRVQP